MANIVYRVTATPEVRVSSSVKAAPLTYAEADTNFSLLNADIAALKSGTLQDASGVTAAQYGSNIKIPQISFNTKGVATAAADIDLPHRGSNRTFYRTNASLTTIIPLDDTIPQLTEGTQIATLTFTPKSATSVLRITVKGICSMAAAGTAVFAVFRDSTANAIAASAVTHTAADQLKNISLSETTSATAASSTTFTLRVGPGATGTVRCNGSSTTRFFGGVSGVEFMVEELAV